MTAPSCEFQNYLGAVTLSSSLTQDSRSRGSVTVWAIVTPTCNIVRQQHLFSSFYNYNGYLQWIGIPVSLTHQNYLIKITKEALVSRHHWDAEKVSLAGACHLRESKNTEFLYVGDEKNWVQRRRLYVSRATAYESVCQESLHYIFKLQGQLI